MITREVAKSECLRAIELLTEQGVSPIRTSDIMHVTGFTSAPVYVGTTALAIAGKILRRRDDPRCSARGFVYELARPALVPPTQSDEQRAPQSPQSGAPDPSPPTKLTDMQLLRVWWHRARRADPAAAEIWLIERFDELQGGRE